MGGGNEGGRRERLTETYPRKNYFLTYGEINSSTEVRASVKWIGNSTTREGTNIPTSFIWCSGFPRWLHFTITWGDFKISWCPAWTQTDQVTISGGRTGISIFKNRFKPNPHHAQIYYWLHQSEWFARRGNRLWIIDFTSTQSSPVKNSLFL